MASADWRRIGFLFENEFNIFDLVDGSNELVALHTSANEQRHLSVASNLQVNKTVKSFEV
jgi:hypothetical protein